MQPEPNAEHPQIRISRHGILVLNAHDTALRVERGMLSLRSSVSGLRTEALIPKVSDPALRRLVIVGRGGYATFDVFSWLGGIGATYLH